MPGAGEFTLIVRQTHSLAMVALVSLVKRFPDYGPIIDSNLMRVWDCLMTIAMTGVAAHKRGSLSDSQVRAEIERALHEEWQVGGELFDDYYQYVMERTAHIDVPWSAVSAMWVADNLRLHERANSALRQNAADLSFVNRLSIFMNIACGNTELGLSHYLAIMSAEVDKGKDAIERVHLLAYIYKTYASKAVEFLADGGK